MIMGTLVRNIEQSIKKKIKRQTKIFKKRNLNNLLSFIFAIITVIKSEGRYFEGKEMVE